MDRHMRPSLNACMMKMAETLTRRSFSDTFSCICGFRFLAHSLFGLRLGQQLPIYATHQTRSGELSVKSKKGLRFFKYFGLYIVLARVLTNSSLQKWRL